MFDDGRPTVKLSRRPLSTELPDREGIDGIAARKIGLIGRSAAARVGRLAVDCLSDIRTPRAVIDGLEYRARRVLL
jgi:hypothetical protein